MINVYSRRAVWFCQPVLMGLLLCASLPGSTVAEAGESGFEAVHNGGVADEDAEEGGEVVAGPPLVEVGFGGSEGSAEGGVGVEGGVVNLDGGFEAWEETIVSIASAVNWPLAVKGLKGLGADFFECGFGSQLKNLTGWIDRGLKVESLQTPRVW